MFLLAAQDEPNNGGNDLKELVGVAVLSQRLRVGLFEVLLLSGVCVREVTVDKELENSAPRPAFLELAHCRAIKILVETIVGFAKLFFLLVVKMRACFEKSTNIMERDRLVVLDEHAECQNERLCGIVVGRS